MPKRKTRFLIKPNPTGQILLYQTEDGLTKLEVKLVDETVWLTQLAMAELFQTTKQNISLHLKNIFEDEELTENRVVKDYLTTGVDGKKYQTKFYNLEVIIAVGYRVHSKRGTQFRRWATERLNEYLVKGFTMDDERLKQVSNIGSDYFDEMLERIRDIRSSEKRFYQKIAISTNSLPIMIPKLKRHWNFFRSFKINSILPFPGKRRRSLLPKESMPPNQTWGLPVGTAPRCVKRT